MEITWEFIAIGIFSIIGILVFTRAWRFISQELKTAARVTLFDKIQVFLSAFVFSGLAAAAVVFILAIISSSIAINAIYAIAGTEQSENYADIINAWQFPNLIPIVFLVLAGYSFIYPAIEYLMLSKRDVEGPMEIQRWIESKIITRWRPPFSAILAILLFIVVVIIPPLILSYVAINVQDLPAQSGGKLDWQAIVFFSFLSWLILGPIFYLSYYSTLGNSQIFLRGTRIKWTDPQVWKNKKNIRFLLFYFIAIISIISSFYNAFKTVPIFWGVYPELTTDYLTMERGFIETFVTTLLSSNPSVSPQQINDWKLLTAIVPIDFLMFFISTCGFGLLGFYMKFISKEPLNRSTKVAFAAYVFSGIAFEIFVQILTKWPWVIPDQRILFNLSDPTDQKLMLFFFAPILAIDKTILAFFLTYNLFFNKELKTSIQAAVLNDAILDNDVAVMKQFTENKNPAIRLLVSESVGSMLTIINNPELLKGVSQIIERMAFDEDPKIQENIISHFDIALQKLPAEYLYNMFSVIFSGKNEHIITKFAKVIIQVGKVQPNKIAVLFEETFKGSLSEEGKSAIFKIISDIGEKQIEFAKNLLFPLIEKNNPSMQTQSLFLIKNMIDKFSVEYSILFEKCLILGNHQNDDLSKTALSALSVIAIKDPTFVPKLVEYIPSIKRDSIIRKKAIIALISELIVNHPSTYEQLIDQYKSFTEERNGEVLADFALSIGMLCTVLENEKIMGDMFPILKVLVDNKDVQIQANLFNSISVLATVKEEIFMIADLRQIFFKILLDSDKELRAKIFEFLQSMKVELLVQDLETILDTRPSKQFMEDYLMFIASMSNKIYPLLENTPILDKIICLDIDDKQIFLKQARLIANLSKRSRKIYFDSFAFIESLLDSNDDEKKAIGLRLLADIVLDSMADKIEIPKSIKSILNEVKPNSEPKLDLETMTDVCIKLINPKMPATIVVVLYYFDKVLDIKEEYHEKIYPALTGLTRHPNEDVISNLIRLITKITIMHSGIYFTKKTMLLIKTTKGTEWQTTIYPFLLSRLNVNNAKIMSAVSDSLKTIADKLSNRNEVIELLLKGSERGNPIDTRILSITAIVRIENIVKRKDILVKVFNYLSDPYEKIRLIAREYLGNLILSFHAQYLEEKQKNPKRLTATGRLIKSLIYRYIAGHHVKEKSEKVRAVYLEKIKQILFTYKEFEEVIISIKNLSLDANDQIALNATNAYFTYIKEFPQKIKDVADYLPTISRSNYRMVKMVVLKEIGDLYEKEPKNLKLLLPSLLTLAIDKDANVRATALRIFKSIYDKAPEKLLYFSDSIFKLSRNNDPRIRKDSIELISALIFKNPDLIIKQKKQKAVLLTLIGLSHDIELSVRAAVSGYLSELLKVYPTQINNILHIVFYLIEEREKEIMQNSINAIREIAVKYPERKVEIIKTLKRYYKKSQNSYLKTLIEELS